MNKETVQKNVYILHLNYRTVYCPKKALNCEMGNTVMANGNIFRAQCWWRLRLWAVLGWCNGGFYCEQPVADPPLLSTRGFFPSVRTSAGHNRARPTPTCRSRLGSGGSETLRQRKKNLWATSYHTSGWGGSGSGGGVSISIQSVLHTFLSMSFTCRKFLIVFTGPNVIFHIFHSSLLLFYISSSLWRSLD